MMCKARHCYRTSREFIACHSNLGGASARTAFHVFNLNLARAEGWELANQENKRSMQLLDSKFDRVQHLLQERGLQQQ